MARQRFFPRSGSARALWYGSYARGLHELGPALGLPPAEVVASVADALYLAYCTGSYGPSARAFAKASTAAVRGAVGGSGTVPVPMLGFEVPPLPGSDGTLHAVVPVAPGAHRRIMKFVELIKARPACTPTMCVQMGIIGAGEAAAAPVPTFTLETVTAPQGQHVRIRFRKYGRKGVVIHCKRAGGDWEMLGVDMASPFVDKRPLLVAGQPETREYRLRFFEDDASTGEYTPVASITVGV
ncbi:MAG: hypothetical protein HY301_17285 [Verrucomicrobia bacterium]|nr:hypothetical protein [Verrucomicrobiota bacterium]